MSRRWLWLLLWCLAGTAWAGRATDLPEGVELPMRVRLAVRVLNITAMREVSGQVRLHLETTQRWHDPRLVFDAVRAGSQRIDRVGDEAQAYIRQIWTPGLLADNRIGEMQSHSLAVSVHANGEVQLVERYESDFRVAMNLAAFPFDRQQPTLSFSLPRYPKQEAILVANERERRYSGIAAILSVADWRGLGMDFFGDETTGWNAQHYSRLNTTLHLERLSERYILRIFIPIITVLAVSIYILWAPALQAKDKGSIVFSSLLALAAISFTFEASFPGSISLNTPVAQMISLGYVYLVLVLLVDSVLAPACENPGAPRHALHLRIRQQVRWLLPAMMFVVCAGAALRAIPV
jgi:hypothetical protein